MNAEAANGPANEVKSLRETVKEFDMALYKYTVPSAWAMKMEEPFCEAVITVLALVKLLKTPSEGNCVAVPEGMFSCRMWKVPS